MKITMSLFLILISFQSIACIDFERSTLCRGDLVFPDNWTHNKGGKVVALSYHSDEVSIKSNSTGNISQINYKKLSLNYGCAINICVGNKVFPDNWTHNKGGKVVGYNPYTEKFVVKSRSTQNIQFIKEQKLSIRRGCVEGVYIGDLVLPTNWTHNMGGKIVAMNPFTRVLTVKSKSTNNIQIIAPNKLPIAVFNERYKQRARRKEVFVPKKRRNRI